jgi:hypothetical protein
LRDMAKAEQQSLALEGVIERLLELERAGNR